MSEYQLLLQQSHNVIARLDSNFHVQYINPAVEELTEYSLEEMKHINIFDIIHPDDALFVEQKIQENIKNKRQCSCSSFRIYTKSQKLKWIEISARYVYNNDGSLQSIVINEHDITRQKNIVREKDHLLQEMNHRIKNNLLIIASLIDLKNDSEPSVDLSDLKHQINAIRLIHQKLYETSNIKYIKLKEYIDDLLSIIFGSLLTKKISVENTIDDDVIVSTKFATSIGIIINEIATNAIKYGFTGQKKKFTVNFIKDGNYTFIISNSGKSFPPKIDVQTSKTIGLRLISTLIDQHNGSLYLQRKPYPIFTISFPKDELL